MTDKKTPQYKYTIKEALFCQEYIIDFNGTQAYMRAGYKASAKVARINASKLLTKPNINAKIKELVEARAKEAGINAQWVLDEALEVYRMAKGAKPHIMSLVKDGKETKFEMHKTNLREATKALTLIGRHIDVKAFDTTIDIGDGVVFTCVLPKELENNTK